MSDRKYSVGELDDLRNAIRSKYKIPVIIRCSVNGSMHIDYAKEMFVINQIEEYLRTHMLAGHTAEDLYVIATHRPRAEEIRG